MTFKLPMLTIAMLAASTACGLAQSPDDGKGRYALSPVDGGVLRLDKETGAMALCTRKADQWACEAVPEKSGDKAKGESKDGNGQTAKLEAENQALKDRIKVLEDSLAIAEGANKSDGKPGDAMKQLPTEEEVDKALDYVERIFKKFRDRIQKYEQHGPSAPAEPAEPVEPPKEPQSKPL